jgi:hypothetical protein
MPRDNIDTLARTARRAAANTLAALCVVRGADYSGGDAVERAVLAMAAPDIDSASSSSSSADAASSSIDQAPSSYDIATASEWPGGIAKVDVLISPAEARSAWREFMSASTLAVQQAKITQQANLAAGKRAPPLWAVFMIMFLGWNEFVAVIWNPIYLVLGFLMFAFGWALYSELDVDARMQQGWVAGALGIWNNLGNAVHAVSERAVHVGAAMIGEGRQLLQERADSPQQQGDHPRRAQQSAHQQHMSAAGLTRRKQEADGVQMVNIGGGGAAAMAGPKDE